MPSRAATPSTEASPPRNDSITRRRTDLGSPHAAGCDQDVGGAWDVSADGHAAVGLVWNGCTPDASRWSDASGSGVFTLLELLGSPAPGSANPPTNRATVISDDGTTVAGFAQSGVLDRTPALWGADGAGELLVEEETDAPGEVLSISADGATVAGIQGLDGFVWTRAAGLVPLARFDVALPSDPVYPNAMTADGRFLFGGVGDAFFGIPVAFVWSEQGGMTPLAEVAEAAGIDLPEGLVLNSVLGASADGTLLAGTATDAGGNPKTFVLRLPAGALPHPALAALPGRTLVPEEHRA